MVNGEPGGNFSSPKDKTITVVSIKKGTEGKGAKLLLSDGSSFFITDDTAASLEEGASVDESSIHLLMPYKFYLKLLDRAYKILSIRDHSLKEITVKLSRRTDFDYAVPYVLSILDEQGFIDDVRFAELWLRNRFRRNPRGYPVLMGQLRQKGVSAEDAEEAFRKLAEEETGGDTGAEDRESLLDQAAFRAVEKMLRNNPEIDRDKIIKRMKYRGFSYPRICKSIKKFQEGS
ncbi:MAG: regulatory protein RecX [Spirochaetia bacterium]